MKLLIDTCTWMKLDVLKDARVFSPDLLYQWAEVQISHDVLEEIDHFRITTFIREKTTVLPIGNELLYRAAQDADLDAADASLISNGSTDSSVIIVSEDSGLIDFARLRKIVAMELIDFFQLLTEGNYLTKRDLYNKARTMRELRNITKKQHKEKKRWLMTH